MKISILGSGAYGIALALMFNENDCEISLWEHFEQKKEEIIKTRENASVLPGVKIPENIYITSDLAECIKDSELIVIAIPAGFVDEICVKIGRAHD